MKCNKCGSEWKTDASRSSSLTVCPFCQERLENEKTGGWQFFDNTKELLIFIVSEYGADALFGRKYFADHSAPLMPQIQKNLVKQAFECGSVKILQDNVNSDQQRKEIAVKQAVGKLMDTYAIAQNAAERVVWEFANAIGWGMPEPTGTVAPPPPTDPVYPPPKHDPSVPINIAALMTLANNHLEDSEWSDAIALFTDVLKVDPGYSPAYVGLICADLKITQEGELAKLTDPNRISSHKHYKRVADPAAKARLDGYIQTIKARIKAEQEAAAKEAERKRRVAEEATRKKRVQDAFDNACKIMNGAKSPDDYRKAITAFGSIDSNYQDINSQIKGKIAECEQKMKQLIAAQKAAAEETERKRKIAEEAERKKKAAIEAEFRKKYGLLLDRLSKEGKAQAEQRHKSAQIQIDEENAKAKAAAEAKYAQMIQRHDTDHMAWQENVQSLKTQYTATYKAWEDEANRLKAQSEAWKAQGSCPHCGGALKGLFAMKCTVCGKPPGEAIAALTAPTQPNYPAEPKKPQMPTFTPRRPEAQSDLPSDVEATIRGEFVFVTMGGIDWRVLVVESNKALLVSENVLEQRPYNVERKDITWENCTLRKYLNGEFYNKLGAAKSAIADTRNPNPNNPWYDTSGGNATTDKVFLLSLDEVCRYFGDSTAELKNVRKSDWGFHDKNSPNRVAKDANGKACWWWLRSPGNFSYYAARVSDVGYVDVFGNYVSAASGGVRPALWLNL